MNEYDAALNMEVESYLTPRIMIPVTATFLTLVM